MQLANIIPSYNISLPDFSILGILVVDVRCSSLDT